MRMQIKVGVADTHIKKDLNGIFN